MSANPIPVNVENPAPRIVTRASPATIDRPSQTVLRRLTKAAFTLLLMMGPPLALADSADASAVQVFRHIDARLELMKSVAHWKLVHEVPIEDPDRELVVLDAAAETAVRGGIDGSSIRPFFRSQIEAAKEIQRCWFNRWQSGEALPSGEAPDLKTDIRPRLIELGSGLIDALSTALANGVAFDATHRALFEREVEVACLGDAQRMVIYEQLRPVDLL